MGEGAGGGREEGGREGMYGRSESQGSSARRTCTASRTGFFVSGVAGLYFSRYNDVLVFLPGAAVPLRVSLYRAHTCPASTSAPVSPLHLLQCLLSS